MSLATFSDLKASIAAWVKRADLAAQIPDFISLAEARIARDLRLDAQIITSPATTVANVATVALPAGCLELVTLEMPGYGTLEATSRAAAAQLWDTSVARPRQFLTQAGGLTLWPIPDGAYTLSLNYYQRFALSDAAPTNWLLTNHPGVYLWAALAEAEPYVANDPRIATWEGKYQQETAALRAADARARFSGGPVRTVAR